MSKVYVCGLGAVSPAGWNVAALREALARGEPLPVDPLERPGWKKPLRMRLVPNPVERPRFLMNPRLRRSSPITHYAAAAAMEAAAAFREKKGPEGRLGLIVCLQSGCVQYTFRFFKESLENPGTASPLLFPETVFAAPASHVSTLLGNTPVVSTIIGDPASFLQGLALGASWLESDQVDGCVIVGSEEVNWLRADALWHLEHAAIICAGAGALCLCRDPSIGPGIELTAVTEAQTFTVLKNRVQAARAMRNWLELAGGSRDDLLCDGLGDSPRTDRAEAMAWNDWAGARVSPKRILGEGLMAAAGWQCVAACDALASGKFQAAMVSLVGCNQQAVGARFMRAARVTSTIPANGQTAAISR